MTTTNDPTIYEAPNTSSLTQEITTIAQRDLTGIRSLETLEQTRNFIRWDGKKGTAREILLDTLSIVKTAVNETPDQGWISLGTSSTNGIEYSYHDERTKQGNGNRFFKLVSPILKGISPQLMIAAMMDPHAVGAIDHTVRNTRMLKKMPDGKTFIYQVVAEAGPRPIFSDRDDVGLTGWEKDQDGTYWQMSCSLPGLMGTISGGLRIWTMVWGYRFENLPPQQSDGSPCTRVTLISQTEIFGWLPKFLVNSMVYKVLADYIVTAQEYLVKLSKDEQIALMKRTGLMV
jgi:hypothetical protein